ncbi:P-loop containing nucleoside triphosphate hydrolase protein [Xylariales sp. PMI_506]|nr:P-loop containing nucleoside triphosphate hydrolase protein [Xylariales sp. PMI_506]
MAFSWMDEIVWKAYRATLEASDLNDLKPSDKAGVLAPAFRAAAILTLPLTWRMIRFFKFQLLTQAVWAVITSLMLFVPAALLRSILLYLEDPATMTSSAAWLCVAGLLVSQAGFFISDCQCQWVGQTISLRLRAVLVTEVYAKVLRRKMARPPADQKAGDAGEEEGPTSNYATDGNIINLMSVDAETVSIAIGLLYSIIGISGVIGVAIMVALMPLHIVLVRKLAVVRGKVLQASDARMQASTELLSNIRLIKYSGWESAFGDRVLAQRQAELKILRSRFIWWSANMAIFFSIPLCTTMLTFLFYTVIFGNSLESSTAFPALATFAVLRIPLDSTAEAITYISQAYISVNRIDKFLMEEETEKYLQTPNHDHDGMKIGCDGAMLYWSRTPAVDDLSPASTATFRLSSLSVRFDLNGLNVICGPSGSGKSSLLLALLGEMELQEGQMHLPHDTAYCAQEPWILNSTIRANILFGHKFDAERYAMVINAVALGQDLATFVDGDQSLAGEKGSRLSGGQKQRIALARALYSNHHCVLLDDCLSAVDAKTAKHIFFHAIKGPLMKDRTCILATHHKQLAIPHSDYVVLLDKGRITGCGKPAGLVSAGLIDVSLTTASDQMMDEGELGQSTTATADGETVSNSDGPKGGTPPIRVNLAEAERPGSENSRDYDEKKQEGSIPWSVVRWYLNEMGPSWYWGFVALGFVAQQLASLGTNLWIKEWARQYDLLPQRADGTSPSKDATSQSEPVNAAYYLAIYALLTLSWMLITFFRDAITLYGSLRASSRIYKQLLESVLHAKLIFFDRVPLGQITNRLSKDVQTIDQELATTAVSTMQSVASIALVLGLITALLPAFFLAGIFICVAYYIIMIIFVSCSRNLRRIEAVERSPLYQHFGETLVGYVTIRAYGRTPLFTAKNHGLVDRFSRPGMLSWASREWLTVRVSTLSSIVVFLAGCFVLWRSDSIGAGTAGLVLTYAVTLTEQVLWLVQLYGMTQQNLNSVERTLEYTEVEQEALQPLVTAADTPKDWPARGGIRFDNFSARYAPELEPAIQGISFEARPGERVAVVGRTGAGKSTLALALIRGLEADGGRISIDGVDISSLKLQTLRRAVTVIPQEPTLFNGSLRDNLDPLRQYSDDEILAALADARLSAPGSTAVADTHALPDLHHPAVALSLGQRQLLHIARALLRKSRVLLLDEATASIDHETDALIQRTIRNCTETGTTVLTIAHRLQTVADYDRVIVMDAGRVVEQGSLRALLKRRGPDAVFRRLCEESGDLEKIEALAGWEEI